MSTSTTTARNEFLSAVCEPLRTITSENLTKSAWVAGVEIIALANRLADLEVSVELLENEIKLGNLHFAVDGHNWSDYAKVYNNNFVELCQLLRARRLAK
jgi:hypothetical protein